MSHLSPVCIYQIDTQILLFRQSKLSQMTGKDQGGAINCLLCPELTSEISQFPGSLVRDLSSYDTEQAWPGRSLRPGDLHQVGKGNRSLAYL